MLANVFQSSFSFKLNILYVTFRKSMLLHYFVFTVKQSIIGAFTGNEKRVNDKILCLF